MLPCPSFLSFSTILYKNYAFFILPTSIFPLSLPSFLPFLMATPQENAFLMQANELEFEQEQGCGCFRSFGLFTSRKHVTKDIDRLHLLPERREEGESWVVRQVIKLREMSELVAGPKWKNFIRKVGAFFNTNNKKKTDFQYDSFNYTLNFDDGMHEEDSDGANLGFSSRFAPPVVLYDKPRSSS